MSSTYLLPDKVIFTDSRAQNLGISGGGVAIMQLITEMLMVLMAKIMKMAMMLL